MNTLDDQQYTKVFNKLYLLNISLVGSCNAPHFFSRETRETEENPFSISQFLIII